MLCAYKRPRYQVSVFKTIGPLVIFFFGGGAKKLRFCLAASERKYML